MVHLTPLSRKARAMLSHLTAKVLSAVQPRVSSARTTMRDPAPTSISGRWRAAQRERKQQEETVQQRSTAMRSLQQTPVKLPQWLSRLAEQYDSDEDEGPQDAPLCVACDVARHPCRGALHSRVPAAVAWQARSLLAACATLGTRAGSCGLTRGA